MWSLFEWQDITGIDSPWATESEVKELVPALIQTVGTIVHEDSDYITIAGSVGKDGELGNVSCIPRGCLISIENFTGLTSNDQQEELS